MVAPELLEKRLQQIAGELAARDGTLALLGLGSVGKDTDRLDEFSDLDFFVIVDAGYKQRYISDLDWLTAIGPLAYSFLNTPDGHKALYEDGVFCEFAVFETAELPGIAFERGRVIWSRSGFDTGRLKPAPRAAEFGQSDTSFLLGELLTNLYVGLSRYARGERLSACLFVQNYAVARLISLLEIWNEADIAGGDPFSNDRRFEQRYPAHQPLVESLLAGYSGTPDSAERMLEFVCSHTDVNEVIASRIRRLIAVCREGDS